MSFDVEQIFQSIDVILTQRLNDLSYDKTIIATIVDDSDKEAGHYIVSDGTIKFDAYANDLNYKVDDQVRVTILNGDWSQKKFIAGRYSDKSNNTTPFVYTPPLSTAMLDSDSSLFTKDTWTLQTNANPHVKCIYEKDITAEDKYYSLQTYGIYNTFTLAADFNTNFDAIDGNYGLLLMLYVNPIENSNELIAKFTTLDSSEMLGNPYSYRIDSRQAKQISVMSEGIVRRVELYIYQAADFEIYEKNLAWSPHPFIGRDGNELGANSIIFRNIQLGFGSDLTKIEDNSLKIYTTSPATYHYNNGAGDISNDKVLGLTWYNKSDDDEYIGFSDGVITLTNDTINQYDEIDYLVEQHADVRLLKYKGQTNIPTDIISLQHAADINESKPYLTKTYQMLTGKNGAPAELVYYLQTTARALAGTTLETDVSKLISSYTSGNTTKDAILVEYANKAELAVQRLINKYNNVLAFGYEVQTQQPSHKLKWADCWRPKEPTSTLISTSTSTYMTTFNTQIDGAIQKVRDFVNKLDANTAADQTLAGYRGIYDAYAPKILRAIEAIELERSKIIVTPTSEANLAQYENWDHTHYEPYAEKDLSAYHNKYCIYWYRYNPKYSLEYIKPITEEEYNSNTDLAAQYKDYYDYTLNLNREYTFGQFLGPNWERVQVDKDNNPIQNLGLPITKGHSENIKIDGILQTINYFPASPDPTQLLYRRMDPYMEEERYQAVLFYNHTQVNSNIITFINSEADQIPAEFAVDANDKLIIEHDADSQDHYQSYTSAYDLVNIADESKSRSLRVSYDGVFSGDEALADAGIYWYVPLTATMLTYDKRHLIEDLGFTTDEESKTPFSKEGYIYFYKQIKYTSTEEDAKDVNGNIIYNADGTAAKNEIITIDETDRYFEYKIKAQYEPSAQNNTIVVEAHIHGENGEEKITTGEIFFTFSTFGTNGTKYTFIIEKTTTQTAVLPNKNLDLAIFLKDAENNFIPINEAIGIDPSLEVTPPINTYSLSMKWHARRKGLPVTGSFTTPIAIEGSEKKAVSVQYGAIDSTTKYVGILGAKVSYTTEGKDPTATRVITLNTLYPVPYSSNENYYISGPTAIVYNNQGVLSRLSEDPFKLYSRYEYDDNGNYIDSNKIVPGQKWSLMYFDESGNIVADDDIIRNYMPSLNSDNTIMPAPMYYSYSNNKFYVPVAVCTIADVEGNEDIAWTQPIIITQNQYASPTLNDWNGEFKIDEANGTILSTMLGAGRKTENNTFEGVLMGDIVMGADMDTYHTTARGNASGIGLYGFNDGAQSFYFGVDGTAFLGKATSGRINFDGNNGFIYSQQWLNSFRGNDGTYVDHFVTKTREDGSTFKGLKPGKSGLAIDLQSGHIDAYDFKVTSKNIYLNSNPDDTKNGVKDYYFRIGNNGQAAPNSYEDLNSNGDAPQLTKGYMAMSKDGDLEIRANSLSLTGQLGGVNLLRQTSPKRTLPLVTMIKTKTTSNPTDDDPDGEISYSYNMIPMTDTKGNVLYDWDVTKKTTYTKYKTYCLSKGYTAITYENQEDFNADNKRTKYRLNGGSYSPTSSYSSGYSYYVQAMEPISEDEWDNLSVCYWNCADNVFLAGTTPNETFYEANKYKDRDFYLAITAKETSVEKKVSQTITADFKQGEYYTLSGYVSSLKAVEGVRHLNISFNKPIEIPNWSQTNEAIEFTRNNWTRFEITFKLTSDATSLQIDFASSTPDTLESVDFALWHLKLESGSIASAWTPAPDDTEDTIRAEQDKFDTYLSQDVIFDRLVTDDNGEKMVGIWLLPGEDSASGHNELYINATYMSTGILRSSNWDGIIGKKSANRTDVYGRNIYTYEITKAPKTGLYLNLDQGKMWAANFELDAGNSNEDGDGLYLNSNPANGQNWFYLGDTNNHIKFDKTSSGSSLTLKMQKNFTLTAGSGDNYLALYSADQSSTTTINSQAKADWRIVAGKKFGVDKAGNLYASNATVTGTVTATGGSIGDWVLDSGALKSSDGGIILASKAVTIGGTTIAANTIQGGTLKGATMSGGKIVGSAIYAQTLDIGGYKDGTVGSGAFSVAADGSITIGTATSGVYPFSVTSGGNLTARTGTIGGWTVTAPSGTTGGGFSFGNMSMNTATGLTFGTNGVFSVGIDGVTKIKDLVVDNTFKVKSARTDTANTLEVDSSGNLKFKGNIYVGPNFAYSGYGSSGDGGTQKTVDTDGDGFKSIKIDTPWSNSKGTMTFYNGILVGFKTESSTLKDFLGWLFGTETDSSTNTTSTKSIGSSTRPVWVNKGEFTAGAFNMPSAAPTATSGISVLKYLSKTTNLYSLGWQTLYAPTSRGNSNYLWVGKGTSNDPEWASLSTVMGTGSAGTVWAADAVENGNMGTFSPGWKKIYAPTIPGTDGYVWTSNGSGGQWEALPAAPTLKDLLPSMSNKGGKVLKVKSDASGVEWAEDKDTNTTYSEGTGIDISNGVISCTVTGGVSSAWMSSSGTARYVNAQSISDGSYVAGVENTNATSVRKSNIKVSSVATSSSRLYKNNINTITNSDLLLKCRPVSFYFNQDMHYGNNLRYGFIAEEVEEFFPELVTYDLDNSGNRQCISLNYNDIIALAVAEIQKLRKELDELKSNLNKE